MRQTIGVMGCGWLGLPLAKSWVQLGVTVRGTTTTTSKCSQLEKVGITAFNVRSTTTSIEGNIGEFLNGLDVLILNVPPKLRRKSSESFVSKMSVLLPYIEQSTVQFVLFISSTSVYGDAQGEVTAKTVPMPTSESGRQLLEAEQVFLKSKKFQTTILRLGGLVGIDRHPITMLSGKSNIKNGNAPINLIHQEDCIGIIQSIVSQSVWGNIYCAAVDFHPTKKEYYTAVAVKRNLSIPKYTAEKTTQNKKVNSQHLMEDLGYSFRYPCL